MVIGALVLTFLICVALGAAFGTWRYLLGVLVVLLAMLAALWIGDGLYGSGWGEFGVEIAVLFAAAVFLGVAAGAIGARALRAE